MLCKAKKKIPAIGMTEMDTLRIMIKIFLKDQLSKLSKLTQLDFVSPIAEKSLLLSNVEDHTSTHSKLKLYRN